MSKSTGGGIRGLSISSRPVMRGARTFNNVMNTSSAPGTKLTPKRLHLRFRYLILVAALFHIAVAGVVFTAGKLQVLPSQFAPNGLAAFAADGYVYQTEAVALCDVLKSQGLAAWAAWPTQLHIRLYSLPLFAFYRWVGLNILTIEPLNLFYYLGILVLIFRLGETVFDYRAGLLAATVVGLWPSLLLHTTQLLRDPLLIAAFLLLMLSLIECLKRDYSWQRGLLWGLSGAVAIVTIRIVRLPMWDVIYVIIGLTVLFLVIRSVKERRVPYGNVAFAAIMITALWVTPYFQTAFRNQTYVNTPRLIVPEEVQKLPVAEQIAARRRAFELQSDEAGNAVPSEAGSQVDATVKLYSLSDVVRHLPRAAVVGLFAPFPNMWLSTGKQVGFGGRLLSGFETLLTYMIECFALIGLWSRKDLLISWVLFLAATAGTVALGLMVNNVGALYRLRYSFWILIVILGAGGVLHLVDKGNWWRKMGERGSWRQLRKPCDNRVPGRRSSSVGISG
jgi:putative peptidoglycan lipid II flippase